MRKQIITGLSGVLLGTTALTGVALAQTVTADSTPDVTFVGANLAVDAIQDNAAAIAGSITGTDVDVDVSGPLAGDVIVSLTSWGTSGIGNDATETIGIGAPGNVRAAGVAQVNTGTISSVTGDTLTGVEVDGLVSGTASLIISSNALDVSSRGNQSAIDVAGGAAVASDGGIDAAATTSATDAVATGEIAAATYQLQTGTVTATMGGAAPAARNIVGVNLRTAASVMSNTGGAQIVGNTLTSSAVSNSASTDLTDEVTAGDIDVAAATSQLTEDATVTSTANYNAVGITANVDGATITGAPNSIPVAITDNLIGSSAGGNQSDTDIAARPGGAGDAVVSDTLQGLNATNGNTTAITSDVDFATHIISATGADLTGLVATMSGNAIAGSANGNTSSQGVSVDVGGVGGDGITTTTNQAIAPEVGGTITVDSLVGDRTATAPNVGIGVSGSFSFGFGGGTIADSTILIEGGSITSDGSGNATTATIGSITGNVSAAVSQSDAQSIDASDGTVNLTSTVDEVVVGVVNTLTINNSTLHIVDNAVGSTLQNNAAQMSRGDITGQVTASVTQAVTQSNTEVNAAGGDIGADTRDVLIGPDSVSPTTLAAAGGNVDILIDGNSVSAQHDLNAASSTAADITGPISGTGVSVGAAADQDNVESEARATAQNADIGVTQNAGALGTAAFHTDLLVSDNDTASLARGNVATLSAGGLALTGSVTGDDIEFGVISDQANQGGAMIALTDTVNTGLTGQNNAHGVNGQDFIVQVVNNGADATAVGNAAGNSIGSVIGNVAGTGGGASVGAESIQANSDDAAGNVILIEADTVRVQTGVTGTMSSLATQFANTTTYNVVGNSASSNAVGNSAVDSVGSIDGNVSGTSEVGARATQNNSGARVDAATATVDIGVEVVGGTSDGDDGGTVLIAVAGNNASSAATGNSAAAILGDVTGVVAVDAVASGVGVVISQSNDVGANGGDNNVFIASTQAVDIGYHGADELAQGGDSGQTAEALVVDNSVSASAQASSSAGILGQITGLLSGTETAATVANTQTATSAQSDADVQNVDIGANGLLVGMATSDDGVARLGVNRNSVGSLAAINTAEQTVGAIVGTVEADTGITVANVQSILPDAPGDTLADALTQTTNIGANGSGTIAEGISASVALTVSENGISAAASGNSATQTVGELTGTFAGTLAVMSDQDIGDATADQVVIAGTVDQVFTGVIGAGNIANGVTSSSASIAVADNSSVASASGNALVQNIAALGFTGTLSGSLSSAPTQDTNTANIDAIARNSQIGISGSGGTASADNATANLTVAGNGIGSAASGNSATVNLGELTGTLSGGLSVTPSQTNAEGTDIDALTTNTGIGIQRVGDTAPDAGAVAALTVANNTQSASSVSNALDINAGSLVGAIAGTVTLTGTQSNNLNPGPHSATVNSVRAGISLSVGAIGGAGTVTPVVSGNNTIANLAGNQSEINIASLVQAGASTVMIGVDQDNEGGDPSFRATLENNIDTGIEISGDVGANIDAIVSDNNSSANLVANLAISSIDDLGGVMAGGSVDISDDQSNDGVTALASATDVFTQVVVVSSGDIDVDSIVNNNVIGAASTGNAHIGNINTAGLAVGGTIGVGAIQINDGGFISAEVGGSVIGVDLTPGGTVNGTSIVRGSSIGATAVGNTASSSIR
ncbi:MAG: beta strand repeat-containing protein [Alphaproteobacteria bacterium]